MTKPRKGAPREGGSVRGTKTKEEQVEPTIESNGVDPIESGMDDADAFIVERIAEAVVRKLEEQRKIDLIVQAVLLKMNDYSNPKDEKKKTEDNLE